MRVTRYVLGMIIMGYPSISLAKAPFYYHKADVERATFMTDLAECNELASGVQSPHYIAYSSNMYAMAAGAFFAGFFGSREKRGMVDNVLRTCMADKGYRRIQASNELLKELKHLKDDERAARLSALAASPEPLGEVLPR